MELEQKPSIGTRLLKKADIRLEEVKTDLSGVKVGTDGNIYFSDQEIHVDKLDIHFNDQPLQLSMAVGNLYSVPITGRFNLTAEALDITTLLPTDQETKPLGHIEKWF